MGQSSVSCKHNAMRQLIVRSALWFFQAIATQTSHQTLSITTSSSPSIQSKPSLKKKFPNKSTMLQYFHHKIFLFCQNLLDFFRFLFVFVFSYGKPLHCISNVCLYFRGRVDLQCSDFAARKSGLFVIDSKV